MLIDLIVGSALLLAGAYLLVWCSSPALRARIERPKHDFVTRVAMQDAAAPMQRQKQHEELPS